MDHKVLAFVGPNEAGKTSILDALERLNGGVAMQLGDYPRPGPSAVGPVVEGWFLLRDDDHAVIDQIPGGNHVRWLIHTVDQTGQVSWELRPRLERDVSGRKRTVELLRGASRSKWATEQKLNYAGPLAVRPDDTASTLLDRLVGLLANAKADLTAQQVTSISSLADALRQLVEGDAGRLAEGLSALAKDEAQPGPDDRVYELLESRVPRFVKFQEADRILLDEYDLTAITASPPPSLANLLQLAGTSAAKLREAMLANDKGAALEELRDAANQKLRDEFQQLWGQFTVDVRLQVNQPLLRIIARPEHGTFGGIASSSDGFRAFLALRAFLARHAYVTKPVLLIDEAEQHLHYDAQADLTRMFASQNAACQVIYTTHSAGCLPADLGTAIKPVSREGGDRSTIANSFWTREVGLNGLMLALGSTTFAFTPSRYAVFGEGPADAILLPSLLREATGRDELDFQVVPGTSVLAEEDVANLEAQAQRVVYLVDSDAGGKGIAQMLERAHVSKERIIYVGLSQVPDLTLEDLIDPEVYASAINEELERSGRTDSIVVSDLPDVRRARAVEQLFRGRGLEPPNKVAVAGRIIDRVESTGTPPRSALSILDHARRHHVRDLHNALAAALASAHRADA